MKYIFALLFVLVAVEAQQNEEEIIVESQPAQFMPMGMNRMNPMMYSRNQYPVDYSQGCSGSCGCVQRCQMIWWMPCNCWCPPPCDQQTTPPPDGNPVTAPPTTTSTITTTSTVTTTTQAPTTTAPSCCCSGCSCTPCTIWWMCPPRCPGNCCSNSCRPCPPPPPPPCCSCTPCLPWTPCAPCNCNNPCATSTSTPLKKEDEKEPEYEDPRFPNLRDRLRNGLDIVLSPRQPEPEPLPENRPWRMW